MWTSKSLADGQVATSVGAVYTVPASTKAIIKSATFFNTNVTAQDLDVYITRSGGTRRQLYRFAALAQYATAELVDNGRTLCLSAGDTIDAVTTTATAVDFTITGAEE